MADRYVTPLGEVILACVSHPELMARADKWRADFVRSDRLGAELSVRDIARLTRGGGDKDRVSIGSLRDWIYAARGSFVENPDPVKLRILADALATTDKPAEARLEDMHRALNVRWLRGPDVTIDVSLLTVEEQKVIKDMVNVLLAAHRNTLGDGPTNGTDGPSSQT